MNIVVRSPNWIGDCIMSLPALRALRFYLPQANVFLVTREHLQDIFVNIPEISQIIPIPGKKKVNFFKTVKKLSQYSFDIGILFTNSFQSALLFRMSGVRKLIGYERDWRGFLLYKKMKFPRNEKHHSTFYLDLVECLTRIGFDINRAENMIFSDSLVILKDEISQVKSLLKKKGVVTGTSLVGISPVAAYGSAKEWFPERFSELISRIGEVRPELQFLIFGSSMEKERISKISDGLKKKVLNLAGELSLRESIAAISLCSLFISNDSGLLHIASSVRVPTIALFGPTQPHKTAPPSEETRVLYHPVDCAPCNHRFCPIDHRCMKEIEVNEVYQAAMTVLGPV